VLKRPWRERTAAIEFELRIKVEGVLRSFCRATGSIAAVNSAVPWPHECRATPESDGFDREIVALAELDSNDAIVRWVG
jgi:hypothetical protein